ncbi:MAG: tRNA preQ1(34) S-adenosylmethionine ribosyltransferase-isomerase QueA [Candidatus Omnitrophica bacterium]|nr:tRNA preQ1(34) S-adenosylmethionine ribosyltransferase-isomerase QueA [Candidatus Omnitrophota bacterium]MDD5662329.1 tRNA preQ1(34) S-adenosylmethionine ribosyltransferase-isomerase QueA [Candidatus Omnitrophota bacterium]
MKLSDFDYGLPKELIAQYPLEEREGARLMVVKRSSKTIEDGIFKDFSAYLKKGDLLVLNDTKVLTCRLIGHKATGGKVEILLTKRKSGSTFDALVQPSRTKVGEKVFFGKNKIAGVITNRREISFKPKDAESIYELGQVPLPPYIRREPEELDKDYYQTVYANKEGAIASPTAGLHFTEELLKKIELSGVDIAHLTLHVGLGTFKPVTFEDITKHKMEPEFFQVSKQAQEKLEKARKNKSRIIAVGTTSLRALEAYADGIKEGWTSLFIYPGYKFKLVDCLLTNFHLPKTTLFMLTCAFGGEKLIKQAYQEAVNKQYRFYSYGDAMLII